MVRKCIDCTVLDKLSQFADLLVCPCREQLQNLKLSVRLVWGGRESLVYLSKVGKRGWLTEGAD